MAVRNLRFNYNIAVSNGFVGTEEEWLQGLEFEPDQTTGTDIGFANRAIYNTFDQPGNTDLSNELSDAKIGIVQKIYHEDSIEPTYPATWVKLGSGDYVANQLNIIYVEFVSTTRQEFWITQES